MDNPFQLKPNRNSFYYDYFYPEAAGDIEYYLRLIRGWTPVVSTEKETFFSRKDYMGETYIEVNGMKRLTFDVIFLGVHHFPFSQHRHTLYPDVVSSQFTLIFDFTYKHIYEAGRVCYDRRDAVLYEHDKQVLLNCDEDSVLQKLYDYALTQYRKRLYRRTG